MKRAASAVWEGGIKNGSGKLSSESGVLSSSPYSFKTRFENGVGTNPEELIAAAHAGCYSMALASELEKVGLRAEEIQTRATVVLENLDHAWSITRVELEVTGYIPGAREELFVQAARTAKENCPVSRLLKADIQLKTQFFSEERAA